MQLFQFFSAPIYNNKQPNILHAAAIAIQLQVDREWYSLPSVLSHMGFIYIVAVSFIGGENRRIRRKPPNCASHCQTLSHNVEYLIDKAEILLADAKHQSSNQS
jgi:hypothetical protein